MSDVLLVRPDALDSSQEFPVKAGSRVGTSATRRRALLAQARPDLETVALRGNVPTRVRKTLEGDCDATLLARAGLDRLEFDVSPLLAFDLNPVRWPCAPGQGALGVEIREGDREVLERLAELEHGDTRSCAGAERRLLQISGGGCHSAFGAWAALSDEGATMRVALLTDDGLFAARRFSSATMDSTLAEAAAWLEAEDYAGSPTQAEETWLCRPARAWC